MKFKIGDVVKLKSGGPNMTVNGIKEYSCECFWAGAERGVNKEWFNEEVLEFSDGYNKPDSDKKSDGLSQHEFIVKFREEIRPLIDKLNRLASESIYGLRGAMGYTCPDNEISRGLQVLRYAFIYLVMGAIEQKIDVPERFLREEK